MTSTSPLGTSRNSYVLFKLNEFKRAKLRSELFLIMLPLPNHCYLILQCQPSPTQIVLGSLWSDILPEFQMWKQIPSAFGVLLNLSNISVWLLSRVWLFVTPWTAACQGSLSITNSHSLFKLMFIESVIPSNHLILCRPLLLLPSTFPSIRVFSNDSVLHIRWPKYWSFSFSINPSNEYSFGNDFLWD